MIRKLSIFTVRNEIFPIPKRMLHSSSQEMVFMSRCASSVCIQKKVEKSLHIIFLPAPHSLFCTQALVNNHHIVNVNPFVVGNICDEQVLRDFHSL